MPRSILLLNPRTKQDAVSIDMCPSSPMLAVALTTGCHFRSLIYANTLNVVQLAAHHSAVVLATDRHICTMHMLLHKS